MIFGCADAGGEGRDIDIDVDTTGRWRCGFCGRRTEHLSDVFGGPRDAAYQLEIASIPSLEGYHILHLHWKTVAPLLSSGANLWERSVDLVPAGTASCA